MRTSTESVAMLLPDEVPTGGRVPMPLKWELTVFYDEEQNYRLFGDNWEVWLSARDGPVTRYAPLRFKSEKKARKAAALLEQALALQGSKR